METSQRSIRVMHYIGEFLDLDAKSSTSIAEFIALIQAIREGLGHIDSGFIVSDFNINLLFLSKLQAHPDWNEWARYMLRDHRINVSDHCYSAESGMPFYELAELAIQREREMRAQAVARKKQQQQDNGINSQPHEDTSSTSDKNSRRFQTFTQEEINSFVVRQMRIDQQSTAVTTTEPIAHKSKGHSKRPSQEEINEFVVRQMRKEQERKTRARSKSEPKPNRPATTIASQTGTTKSAPTTINADTARCGKCEGKTHPGQKCHLLSYTASSKPIAAVPRANFTPKKVEFRSPQGVYHTSFALT